MPTASLQAKKAYYAKVRRASYVASLRLEGFQVTRVDASRELPTRESILGNYRNKSA